jgi:ATP adenylyltransferase
MLRVLLEGNGKVAGAFLAHDQAQLDYYEEITKRMPGRVLQNHGLVEREGDGYRLIPPLSDLTEAQREELIRICDARADDYLRRRGAKAYDHRRTALGELSGTVRYQVLSRAGFRCELCGGAQGVRAIFR